MSKYSAMIYTAYSVAGAVSVKEYSTQTGNFRRGRKVTG